MNTIDTRDLIEERDDLKQQILDDFLENFEQYEDMTDSFEDIRFEEEELESWVDNWQEELYTIKEIDNLEDEMSSEFQYGVQMIDEGYWEDYVRDMLEELGEVPSDFPSYITIDWSDTADNVRADYSEIDYNGTTYLYRD